MKSLNELKKAAFVGFSSVVLALGLFAAPAAMANGNGRGGEHRGDRGHREERGDRDRHREDRDWRGHREDRDWRWGDEGRHGRERWEGRWMNWGDRDDD